MTGEASHQFNQENEKKHLRSWIEYWELAAHHKGQSSRNDTKMAGFQDSLCKGVGGLACLTADSASADLLGACLAGLGRMLSFACTAGFSAFACTGQGVAGAAFGERPLRSNSEPSAARTSGDGTGTDMAGLVGEVGSWTCWRKSSFSGSPDSYRQITVLKFWQNCTSIKPYD